MICSGGSLSHFPAGLVCAAMRAGTFQANLPRVQGRYALQCAALCAALSAHLSRLSRLRVLPDSSLVELPLSPSSPSFSSSSSVEVPRGLIERSLEFPEVPKVAKEPAGARRLLPEGEELGFVEPEGGYFVWLPLPALRFPAAPDLLRLSLKGQYGVAFHGGAKFSNPPALPPDSPFFQGRLDRAAQQQKPLSHCLRLSFAYYRPDELVESARRLGKLLQDSLLLKLKETQPSPKL
jgi:DNA-binding transcriptional MocR family regulator